MTGHGTFRFAFFTVLLLHLAGFVRLQFTKLFEHGFHPFMKAAKFSKPVFLKKAGRRLRLLFVIARYSGIGAVMKQCAVSVPARTDGQMHSVDVKAASLFDAVKQANQQWALCWWYDEAVAEVRQGRVLEAQAVAAWAKRRTNP